MFHIAGVIRFELYLRRYSKDDLDSVSGLDNHGGFFSEVLGEPKTIETEEDDVMVEGLIKDVIPWSNTSQASENVQWTSSIDRLDFTPLLSGGDAPSASFETIFFRRFGRTVTWDVYSISVDKHPRIIDWNVAKNRGSDDGKKRRWVS